MTNKINADNSPFPGESDERLTLALNLKEGLTPDSVFEDWGDYEKDYPSTTLDQANATAQNRDDEGLGFSSPEEIQRYYDSLNSADIEIRILRQDDET